MIELQKVFRIKIEKEKLNCTIFWGQSHQPSFDFQFGKAQYDKNIDELYEKWQTLLKSASNSKLTRGKKLKLSSNTRTAGSLPCAQSNTLVKAEENLVFAFNQWLEEQKDTRRIRDEIRQSVIEMQQGWKQQQEQGVDNLFSLYSIDVLIECHSIELARLPWEAWRLSPDNALSGIVRIARVPSKLVHNHETVSSRSKLRILAIFGKADELEEGQKEDIANLEHCFRYVAEIKTHWCNPDRLLDLQQQKQLLVESIKEALVDKDGWDILLFSGHSDESEHKSKDIDCDRLKGCLELARNIHLELYDIQQELIEARQRGLQLVVFNSCKGLHLADSLVQLGVRQVVCWREIVQCKAASLFFKHLCSSLSEHNDIHAAFIQATDVLKSHTVYPSAHLIPSLFRHPSASLFQLQPSRLKATLRAWRPTYRGWITISVVLLCCILEPVRETLFNNRQWVQAVYRQITHQIPVTGKAPITVISIDQRSLEEAEIDNTRVNPMDRSYLAQIVNRLHELNVKVVGIDYFLDRSSPQDQILQQAVNKAVETNATWFIFASTLDSSKQAIQVTAKVAEPYWALSGDSYVGYPWDLMLPDQLDCKEICPPLGYQLAQVYQLTQAPSNQEIYPRIQTTEVLQEQLAAYLNAPENKKLSLQHSFLPRHIYWLVNTSQQLKIHAGLVHIDPAIDLSIAPQQVYTKMPAWEFLECPLSDVSLQSISQTIVIIASGGYDGADDNDFTIPPPATAYWRHVNEDPSPYFSGGETHAYAVYQLLTGRSLIHIPDAWFTIIAAFLGKGAMIWLSKQKQHSYKKWIKVVAIMPLGYGVLGLQSYISLGVWMPWFLPSVTFWLYLAFSCKRFKKL